MFNFIFDTILFVLSVILIVLSPFIISFTLFFLKFYFIDKKRMKKSFFDLKIKKRNFFLRLFYDFPIRFFTDYFNKNPDEFNQYGLHIVSGAQGCGKSITCCYLLREWKNKYPMLKVRTNCYYKYEDEHLESLQDVFDNDNGYFGHVDYFSEIQQQFNASSSKNISPELLGQICMQRKQYKVILGDAQVFQRVAKPLREQVFVLYQPYTFFGCLTYVRVCIPVVDDTGRIVEKKRLNSFFFVHDEDLRNSYDTREVIKHLSKQSFKPITEQIGNYNNNVYIENQGK